MLCDMWYLYFSFIFFFFKQKTAYEMRISDWSSDVCSSDLMPDTRMSLATSLSGTAQQLSVSVGVGLGALILHLTLMMRGGAMLAAGDFWPAFVVVGLISMASVLVYLPLPADAGASVSGREDGRTSCGAGGCQNGTIWGVA